mmetsp:Transcript_1743/g.1912  ORF Transcript_1743/g.1912 Transcript_1743/m.1912 type:complete len:82 (+) Transcript_1743:395-640(+)
MMGENVNEKSEGLKILNNYKNQLTYNKGREYIQNLGAGAVGNMSLDSHIFSTQPPEPEILLDILNEKNDEKEDGIYGSDED